MNEKCESCGIPQNYHRPGGLECVENQLAQAEAALPATFYAGRPLGFRIERMVVSWNRAIRAAVEIEAERDEALEAGRRQVEVAHAAFQEAKAQAKRLRGIIGRLERAKPRPMCPAGCDYFQVIISLRKDGRLVADCQAEVAAEALAASDPATPTPRHVCGLMGFGQPGDKCPACQAEKEASRCQ